MDASLGLCNLSLLISNICAAQERFSTMEIITSLTDDWIIVDFMTPLTQLV